MNIDKIVMKGGRLDFLDGAVGGSPKEATPAHLGLGNLDLQVDNLSNSPHEQGTLVMSVEGSAPDAVSDWHGRWVILRGTDELATLRGQGTWWGPGAPDVGLWGDIYYGGEIHFEP